MLLDNLVTKVVPMFETLFYLNVLTMGIILCICFSLIFIQDGFTLTQRGEFLLKLTKILNPFFCRLFKMFNFNKK
jgi:hypothetical protein